MPLRRAASNQPAKNRNTLKTKICKNSCDERMNNEQKNKSYSLLLRFESMRELDITKLTLLNTYPTKYHCISQQQKIFPPAMNSLLLNNWARLSYEMEAIPCFWPEPYHSSQTAFLFLNFITDIQPNKKKEHYNPFISSLVWLLFYHLSQTIAFKKRVWIDSLPLISPSSIIFFPLYTTCN